MSNQVSVKDNFYESLDVNKEEIENSIKELGARTTARKLGSDVFRPDHLKIAGKILMKDLQQNTPRTIAEYIDYMDEQLSPRVKKFLMDHEIILNELLSKNKNMDYVFDWFSGATMMKTYLYKPKYDSEVCETPQLLYLRMATQFYADEGIDKVIKAYQEMSEQYYTHASPTLFNAGTNKPQMSSCFLYGVEDDLESILMGIVKGGLISKASGGQGLDVSRVRHSEIANVGMSSGIIPMLRVFNEMARYCDQGGKRKGAITVYNRPHHYDVFEFIDIVKKSGDQYSRAHDINTALWMPWMFWDRVRRNEKWTLFCPAKTPELNDLYGKEFEKKYVEYEQLATDRENTFMALKEEVDQYVKETTSLPEDDEKYRQLKLKLHRAKSSLITYKVVKARDLLLAIVSTQRKTGMPYILSADSSNLKSNHRHLGYIRCSNLCLEIIEYISPKEIASCNLASISLKKFVKTPYKNNSYPISTNVFDEKDVACKLTECYDFSKLAEISASVTRNLNKVIDHNWYPLDHSSTGNLSSKEISTANKRHRPLGIGVSGFAETLYGLDLSFESPETQLLNKLIFACMYFNCLVESVRLSLVHGPYESFKGSPFSEGKLQFDLWREEFEIRGANTFRTSSHDLPISPKLWGQPLVHLPNNDVIKPSWDDLKRCVVKYGVRNSLFLALMPTATTAQILQNTETVEAPMSNLYSRKVMNGAYSVINFYLVNDLKSIGLWNEHTVDYLSANNGSISTLPLFIQQNPSFYPNYSSTLHSPRLSFLITKYKTMWELPQKLFLQLASDRGRYIDQSQSTNIYIQDPTDDQLIALHLTTDALGLKTGMYYLRQSPANETIKFTVDPSLLSFTSPPPIVSNDNDAPSCSKQDGCLSCQ